MAQKEPFCAKFVNRSESESMSAFLLTGPQAEPLSVSDAKHFLRVEHDEDDSIIAGLIASARNQIEAHTRLGLLLQTWRVVLDRWPEQGRVKPRLGPLRALTAARIYNGSGVATPLEASRFALDLAANAIAAQGSPPLPGRSVAGIELDLEIGFGAEATDVPPPAPLDGERYVVASGASGAWAGQTHAIATWEDGAWRFLAPKPGWCVWSAADDAMLVYNGTLWRALQGGGGTPLGNPPSLGINSIAISPNLLSVHSNAALFDAIAAADGGTGDVRVQISKEAAVDVASVVFSDAFAGRAEFGLVGSNAFKLKVSDDGATFIEAFVIDQASGNLTLPRGLTLSGVSSPAQIVANQNNYSPAGLASASVLQVFSDAARSLSGLASGAEGRLVSVINVGSQPITLLDEGAASTAANRFALGSDLVIAAKQAALLRYDGTALRWYALTRSGAAASGGLLAANNLSDLSSKAAACANLGVREVLSANRTYYIRTDGNDSNTGLANTSGAAFKTIQRGVDAACALDLGIYAVTIQVGAGTYTGEVTLKSYIGVGPITILGDATTPSNVVMSTSGSCFAGDAILGLWTISGMKVLSTGGFGIIVTNGTSVNFGPMEWGACSTGHIGATTAARVRITASYKISGGGTSHIFASSPGTYVSSGGVTVTLTGSPAIGTIVNSNNGAGVSTVNMAWSGAPAAGTVPYNVSVLGFLVKGGQTIPGSGTPVGTIPGAAPYGLVA